MRASRRPTRSVSRSTARRAVAIGSVATLAGAALVTPASAAVPSTVARIAAAPFTGTQAASKDPVTVDVSYELDGEKIAAEDVEGRTGQLEVSYLVRNRTTTPTDIRYKDGQGKETVETVDLVAPYVGRLAVALPERSGDVQADGAEVLDGGLAWSLVLFNPIGEPAQKLTFSMRVTDAELPEAQLQVAKVSPTDGGVLAKGIAAAQESSGGSTRLTEGVFTIDSSVLKLRDGASQLFDGLVQLAEGAGKLEDGLAGKAAPGAQKLSDGLGKAREGGAKLHDGLGQLSDGSVELGDGLNTANAGGKALATGLDQLVSGGGRLIAGLDSAAAGGGKLAEGLGTLEAGLSSAKNGSGQLAAGLGTASTGADALAGGLPTIAEGLQKIQAGQTKLGVELPAGLDAAVKQVQGAVAQVAVARYVDGMVAGIDGKILPGFDAILASIPASKGGLQCAAAVLDDVAKGATALAPGTSPCYPDGRPTLPGVDATSAAVLGSVGTRLLASAATLGDPTLTPADAAFDPTTLAGGLQSLKLGVGSGAPGSLRHTLTHPSVLNADGTLELNADGSPVDPGGLKQFLIEQINGGLTKVDVGVSTALRNALGAPTTDPTSDLAKTLIGGTSLLAAGAEEAATGSGQLAVGLQQLAAGGTRLDGGLGQLLAGGTTASDGADALRGGLDQLASGGGKLAAGAGAAAEGSEKLSGGLDQLAAGGGKLVAGLDAAHEGSGKLLDGLVQLDDGGRTLATGLGDAAEGSGKLEDGIVKVKDGVEKLRDGAGELSGRGTSALGGSANTSAVNNAQKVAMLQAIGEMGADSKDEPSFDIVLAGASSDADGPGAMAVAGGAAALALLTMAAAGAVVARRRSMI